MLTRINPGDIRKGDNIRKESSTLYRPTASEYWAEQDGIDDGDLWNTYFLLDRPAPPVALPTEPGTVISWKTPFFMALASREKADQWLHDGSNYTDAELAHLTDSMPFTVLRPEAEVAAEVVAVLEAVSVSSGGADGNITLTINAVVFKRLAERWATK